MENHHVSWLNQRPFAMAKFRYAALKLRYSPAVLGAVGHRHPEVLTVADVSKMMILLEGFNRVTTFTIWL